MDTELGRLRKLASLAQIGWWEAEFSAGYYVCSAYLSELLQIDGDKISFADFRLLIRKDYRDQIVREFTASIHEDFYESTFPIRTKYGDVWVRTRLTGRETIEGRGVVSFGMIQIVENHPAEARSNTKKINELIHRQNSISHTLLRFVNEDNIDECIESVLKDVLDFYSGGRVYIFEFDDTYTYHTCTYEVVAEGVQPEQDTLSQMPTATSPWWIDRILRGKPIVLDSLDQLPEDAVEEYEILSRQNIKSIMVSPLRSGDRIWGYIGVDLVNDFRAWLDEDYQWFSSLSKIIAICIDLRKSKDKAVREHAFLQNLFRYMPMGYFKLSVIRVGGKAVDFKIEDANQLSEQITGHPREDLQGKLASDLYGDYMYRVESMLERVCQNTHYETNLVLEKSGRTAHSIVYSPEPDTIVVLLLDSTEMIEAHTALDHSEKLLKSIFANIPVGVEIYDRNGLLVDLNPRDMEIFAVRRKEDVLGVDFFANPNVSQLIKDDVRRHDTAEFRMTYSFERASTYYVPGRSDSIELYTKVSKLYDAQGNFNGYVLINIDNTERILAANRIREFENLFLLISDNAKIGYAKFNYLTRNGFAIPQWYKNLGEAPDTPLAGIIGTYKNVHPDDRGILNDYFRRVEQGENLTFQNEIRVADPGDPERWMWLRVNIVITQYEPENGVIEMIGVNYDITELKETEVMLINAKEKAEMTDRLKSAFIANMSHEIRTPLNAIVGFSGLLAETDQREERMQYMKIIRDNNALLLQLITDILNLSKMESGALEIKIEKIDMASMLDEVATSLRSKLHPQVSLTCHADPRATVIDSDYYRLKQVLLNLIGNAIKFTKEGSISVGYELNGDRIDFYVSDTGIGIPPDQLSNIFERFVKLNDFIPGTGLGLSISKNIVEELGGSIDVGSEPGRGTRFHFTLPYVCGTEHAEEE